MGHRANIVIIQNNKAKAFFDNWAALGCVFIFADGPNAAAMIAEDMEPTQELLDWSFAEGGYLLDFDEQIAIVFGYISEGLVDLDEFEIEDEKAKQEIQRGIEIEDAFNKNPLEYLRYIAPNWKGWHLKWDDSGVVAFIEYLKNRGIKGIGPKELSRPGDGEFFEFKA